MTQIHKNHDNNATAPDDAGFGTASDRAIWASYRAARAGQGGPAPVVDGALAPVLDGADANLLAGYLNDGLRRDEREAVERWLNEDAAALNSLLATAESDKAAPIAMPADLLAQLKAQAPTTSRAPRASTVSRTPHAVAPRKHGWAAFVAMFRQPAFAWTVAGSAALLIAAGVTLSVYTGQQPATTIAAKKPTATDPANIETLSDRFLTDPIKVFFEGFEHQLESKRKKK